MRRDYSPSALADAMLAEWIAAGPPEPFPWRDYRARFDLKELVRLVDRATWPDES